MQSRILKNKTYIEIEEFLFKHKTIYPIVLKEFMCCSYRQAHRIVSDIRKKYNLKTVSIPANVFRIYLCDD